MGTPAIPGRHLSLATLGEREFLTQYAPQRPSFSTLTCMVGYPQGSGMEYSDYSEPWYIFTQGWGMEGQKVSQPQVLKCGGGKTPPVSTTTQRKEG